MICYRLGADVLYECAFAGPVKLSRLRDKLAAKVNELNDVSDKADNGKGLHSDVTWVEEGGRGLCNIRGFQVSGPVPKVEVPATERLRGSDAGI